MASQQLESAGTQVCQKTNGLMWYTTINGNWNKQSVGQAGNKAVICRRNLEKGLGAKTSCEKELSIPSLTFLGHTTARITAFTDLPFPAAFQADGRGFVPHSVSVPGAAAVPLCGYLTRPRVQRCLTAAKRLMQGRSTFPGTKPSSVWNSRVPNPRGKPSRPHPRCHNLGGPRRDSSLPAGTRALPGRLSGATGGQQGAPCPRTTAPSVSRGDANYISRRARAGAVAVSLVAVGDSAAQAGQGPRRGALVMAEASVPSWDANFPPGAADQLVTSRNYVCTKLVEVYQQEKKYLEVAETHQKLTKMKHEEGAEKAECHHL
ncbi:uncharacterized protein LOC121661367 [Corvus kubaryi]|uniref:uncharacterized protein LOC121661367 n=1 Tax=Corvus kubaryi TaxID=68294 RepID=UPI001C045131|nr:uncharacterized protein LOC121661367 [Corvus kubaryi]